MSAVCCESCQGGGAVLCSACSGTGGDKYVCRACGGSGQAECGCCAGAGELPGESVNAGWLYDEPAEFDVVGGL